MNPTPPHTHIPRPGDVIQNQYRLDRELGRGGFSVVYQATQLDLERRVVLKMLLPEGIWSPEKREFFEREARFARSLRHPHIIDLYAYGKTEHGLAFIAMEYLEGRPLTTLIRNGACSVEQVVHIARQVLKALMASHNQGVIHRDIKPSNLFLCRFDGEENFVKVIDFGIAKTVSTTPSEDAPVGLQQHTTKVMGTPLYIAPEQIRKERIGPYTDLYALGLVMGEALLGYPVLPTNLSIGELLRVHVSRKPLTLPARILDSPLGFVVEKATRKDPALRFSSAQAMLRALDRVVQDETAISVGTFPTASDPIDANADLPAIGELLEGRYRIEEEIARRPFSVVYRATQQTLNRPVAVKFLLPQFVRDPKKLEDFCNEVKLVSTLHCPHTISLVDFGQSRQGLPYLVAQWLQGVSLKHVLTNRPLRVDDVIRMALQILDSLDEAHQSGVIHGDIRPEAIFLCDVTIERFFAMLTDFGSASRVHGLDPSRGLVLSDPEVNPSRYSAPEQLRHDGPLSPATDIYALGLVMAEALAGAPVYSPELRPVDVLREQLSPTNTPLTENILRSPLGGLLARATHKDPKQRFASASDLRSALLQAYDPPEISKRPSSLSTLLAVPDLAKSSQTASLARPVFGATTTELSLSAESMTPSTADSLDTTQKIAYTPPTLRQEIPMQAPVRAALVAHPMGGVIVCDVSGAVHRFCSAGKHLWMYQTGGAITASPVVDPDGVVYVGSHDERLHVLDAHGRLLWAYHAGGPIRNTPCLSMDGTVFLSCSGGRVCALFNDGQLRWDVAVGGGDHVGILCDVWGHLRVACRSGLIIHMDAYGRCIGNTHIPAHLICGPLAHSSDAFLLGGANGTLYCVGAHESVPQAWPLGSPLAADPCVGHGGKIFAVTQSGTLVALQHGEVLWTLAVDGGCCTAPVMDRTGLIIVGTTADALAWVRPTGSLAWDLSVQGTPQTPPLMDRDGSMWVVCGASLCRFGASS